jgi:type III restriction enzyme
MPKVSQPTFRRWLAAAALNWWRRFPSRRRRVKRPSQSNLTFIDKKGLSDGEIEYNPTPIINELRQYVDAWRALPNPTQWQVKPATQRLLQHWRSDQFINQRPFFCQVEAVETMIWLTEVAPGLGARGKKFLNHVEGANEQANPGLLRLAMKMATGSGKTTVMAMLIAWHTINAVRHLNSGQFSRGFLIVTSGITIKDRRHAASNRCFNEWRSIIRSFPEAQSISVKPEGKSNFGSLKERPKYGILR